MRLKKAFIRGAEARGAPRAPDEAVDGASLSSLMLLGRLTDRLLNTQHWARPIAVTPFVLQVVGLTCAGLEEVRKAILNRRGVRA